MLGSNYSTDVDKFDEAMERKQLTRDLKVKFKVSVLYGTKYLYEWRWDSHWGSTACWGIV